MRGRQVWDRRSRRTTTGEAVRDCNPRLKSPILGVTEASVRLLSYAAPVEVATAEVILYISY